VNLRFKVLRAVTIKVTVFLVVMPCNITDRYQDISELPAANFRVQWRHHVPVSLVADYQIAWHYISTESNFYGQINPSAFDNLCKSVFYLYGSS
jgi:hypothetical protein